MGFPLTFGSRGAEIADLRARLARWQREHGIADELPGGTQFDDATADAIRTFQRDRNLPADAVVGPETWQALVDAGYALGDRMLWHSAVAMRGDDVLELQHRLNQLGFDAGVEDGIFGPDVRRAVMEFQTNVGLEVDGIVGADTLEAVQRLHRGHQAPGISAKVREAQAVQRLARRGLIGLQVMLDPTDTTAPGDVDVAFDLARRAAGLLGARGARASLSRGRRARPPTSARARMANLLGVDVVISIGLNTEDTPAATGCAAYHYGSLRYVSEAGRELAVALLDEALVAGMGPDCRAHPMTWTLLRETRMPAAVLEPGFATNAEDVARLTDPVHQDRLAHAVVAGLERFLSRYAEG